MAPGTGREQRGASSTLPRRGLVHWGPAGLSFVIALLLALLVIFAARARERTLRRLEFERRAAQVARAAQSSFDVPLEVLRSLPALFEASEHVTRAEFRAFVGDALRRYPWIYALEWIPRVPAEQRAEYEARAVLDGLAGYHFKQDAANGPPVLAEPRSEYFPLYYMEPPNTTALGLEETALDLRRVALERARDTDDTAITERLRLVQDAPGVASVIAFHPVYQRGDRPATVEQRRSALRGFAAAVFRIRPLVTAALRGTDLRSFDVALLDVDAAPARKLLYASRPDAFPAAGRDDASSTEHVTAIASRRLAIRVRDRAGWVEGQPIGTLALLGALGFSVLASAFVHVLRTVVRLKRQVRTARRLGQYTLVEKLGEGNMGVVYRAHHALLRRPTAVKLLQATSDETAVARFEREVQLTSALVHPNTVVVYDYGRSAEGEFYYAMEHIDGITLQDLVDCDGPQPAARVVAVLRQVCAALSEAHGVGLVHRDIKPANIMLCDRGGVADFVKVLDFGLVKQLDTPPADDLSRSTAIVGTPLYLPPEAITGSKAVDARMDIYALAAVAYFMLTGTPVFDGKTVVEVCVKHLSIPPEPLSVRHAAHDAPGELEALLVRCLAKDPALRPASAEEFAASLRALPLEEWSPEAARTWWRERGAAVVARSLEARRARGSAPADGTLEIAGSSGDS